MEEEKVSTTEASKLGTLVEVMDSGRGIDVGTMCVRNSILNTFLTLQFTVIQLK